MSISPNQKFEQASIYSDLGSLNAIRKQGQTDQHGAIKKAAKEFEAFFMNMMLKSMRQASEVMGDNPLMGSDEEKMFTGMMDEQMSINLSQEGHLGIAELMISQLTNGSQTQQNNSQLFKSNSNQEPAIEIKSTEIELNNKSLMAHRKSPVLANSVFQKTTGMSNEMTLDKKTLPELKNIHLMKVNQESSSINRSTQPDNNMNKINLKNNLDMNVEAVKAVKPEKKSLFDEISDFVSALLPLAESAAKKLKLDPKLLLAQAALETGWGKFIMHDESGKPGFNLFGIKADRDWQGESIKINTLEVENQQVKKVNASFRKYDSFSDSFEDYVNFIQQNPRYEKALEAAGNAKEYIKQLQTSGYATDPDYAKKIIKIFSQNIFADSEADSQQLGGFK